jgi:hypothetical protein
MIMNSRIPATAFRPAWSRPAFLIFAIVAWSVGCGRDDGVAPVYLACSDVGWYAVIAEVRDQYGTPAAVGATVRVRDQDGFEDETWGYAWEDVVVVGDGLRGTLEVSVTKPYHEGATLTGVEVWGEGRCRRVTPVTVALEITLADDAPPVRQVVVPPWAYGFGEGNMTRPPIHAWVLADPGLPTGVTWVSRDTAVVRVAADGGITAVCTPTRRSTWLVASAVADPAVRDSVGVTVGATKANSARCP